MAHLKRHSYKNDRSNSCALHTICFGGVQGAGGCQQNQLSYRALLLHELTYRGTKRPTWCCHSATTALLSVHSLVG
jgi:hypothetical protein